MQAIILAAGMGKRLKELTRGNTKCMVKVNGVTLIERMLSQLDALSLRRIILVVGYQAEGLMAYVRSLPVRTPVEFVKNSVYERTNNIYSLYLARKQLCEDDTLLLESDLIFSDCVLNALLQDPYPSLALVAKYESWMDGTVVTLGEKGRIKAFLSKSEFRFADRDQYYKTVNLYKFSREFSCSHYVPFLEAYIRALGENEYYEQVLKVITLLEKPEIRALALTEGKWYEIDDKQDLDIAESIFVDEENRWKRLSSRYGGYWRYPGIKDFCYLVNPYYPPRQMMEEMQASFDVLVRGYPSGLRINNLLAAKYFGIREDSICVGNGAAELIRSLLGGMSGRLGIICPTFEEYANRYDPQKLVFYHAAPPAYTYTAQDIMDFFEDKQLQALCLINPDNPSGNLILQAGLHQLLQWSAKRGIRLIVDESFVDFADPESCRSLLEDAVLEQYPQLVVVKSISKSFGVPGLRLGIAASSDKELISLLKKDVAIWNINSLAEFYLQIFEKYQKDYQKSLDRLRSQRAALFEGLQKISYLQPCPSQANYILCRVTGRLTAHLLSVRLLDRFEILIKSLQGKRGIEGEYIRLAVRDEQDNRQLLEALAQIDQEPAQ
ncbi:MAG: aminotransferase class I/II-fold pyridoxal phosphate-dependent enzyme [Provencibacterium sp.]|nr:aminotransferase class I/II-fold pyridoxal phosphate-dependent enzyme [Provencibacterium sp.]